MPMLLVLLADILVGSISAAMELTGGPVGLTTVAVAAAASLVMLLAVGRPALAPVCGQLIASAVRQRADRTAFLPLLDPIAPGRPQPRAPSPRPRAA
ncbi:DUF6412 domain-containing protein [Phytoactinopolyspora halotolerans]|uniref:Uncharacterized protein n=1 Tax=Phytoactinopolyspora halotolerans TaxID=1981512 RepID=A0A6L9SH72_9ACTN|nr:DUF6412 domain-containing protein [Phytoactinopolyspora halotolerans]NEE04463.1 hypothetical protein [Phytoactinopolyspora halotolerans]